MYFHTLSILATFACAGLTIAAPLGANDINGLTSGVNTPAVDPPALPKVPLEVGQSPSLPGPLNSAAPPGLPAPPVPRDETHLSLPETFQAIVVKVTPVVNKLKVAVAVKAEIDATVVVGLLQEIIDILDWAIIEVRYIVNNPAGFVLSVGETILGIEAVATIISTVLYVVFTVLATVVAAVDGAVSDLVVPLVATIGHRVTELLTLALQLVPGLLTFIVAAVGSLVQTLYFLRVADVVAVLGLPSLV